MGEETGFGGLRELCAEQAQHFSADLPIACNAPSLSIERPTVFLGSRGSSNFDPTIDIRPGGFHSGSWGGLILNPGI